MSCTQISAKGGQAFDQPKSRQHIYLFDLMSRSHATGGVNKGCSVCVCLCV